MRRACAAEPADLVPHDSGCCVMSARLAELPWLRHGCTTTRFTRALPPDSEKLPRVQQLLGMPPMPYVYAQQRHTANVALVDGNLDGLHGRGWHKFERTDGMVCTARGVSIAVFTADCCPILLAAPSRRHIALLHAGWKGTLHRIVEAGVRALCHTGCAPDEIVAWIGPSICRDCYEVSAETIGQFDAEFGDARGAGVVYRDGRQLDVTALNVHQLRRAGVRAANISLAGCCTRHADGAYHSYRGDGPGTGQMITLMAVLPDHD